MPDAEGTPNPSLATQLVSEMRRSSDARDTADAARHAEMLGAVRGLTSEIKALRAESPGRWNSYLAIAIVALAMVSILGLMSTRGVDPRVVSEAAAAVLPMVPMVPDGPVTPR